MRWRRSLSASAMAAVIVVVILGVSSPTRAEEPTDGTGRNVALAERRAAEAFEAYSKGEYSNAVTLYLEAYAASASAPILYNLARIYDAKLDNRGQASAFYRRYIASVDARPDLIKTARLRVEELETTASSGGTSKTADLSPDAVRPAKRGGEPLVPVPTRTPHTPPGWSAQRWVGVALGATGLVGLGVGGAFGLAARSNAITAHELCDGNVCTSQKGVDAARDGQRNAMVSNIGFGAGAALLLTGTILYVTGAERSPEKDVGSGPHLEARVDVSSRAFELAGRW